MSYEIRPAEVISSLKVANQRVEDIVGKADAIVPAVSAISSSPVLQGRGYDALGSSLRGEYTALASVFRIAGSNFTAANNKHLAALGHVSQYGYLNMNQILEEINQIRDAIRDIEIEIGRVRAFHRMAIRDGTASGTADTSGLEKMRDMWETRLETVEKKRDDFEAYLASSAGLYDGVLDLLRCRIDRMDVATLCPATGGLRVPSIDEFEAVRLFEEFVVRDSNGNIKDFKWDLIEAMGQRPYSEWTLAEFAAFALLIEEMKTLEDQARILNALLDPVHDFIIEPTAFFNSELGVFSVCPNKFAAISLFLMKNYDVALLQNDVTRQHNILRCIGLLSAVQMAVGQPPQFVLDGPLTLSTYMFGDPPEEGGVQVNVERIQAGFTTADGRANVHITGVPEAHHVIASIVLSHDDVQDWVAKVAGEFAKGVNTGTVRMVGSAASVEFMAWLLGEIPYVGTIVSMAFGIATSVHGDREQVALVNALVEPQQLASIASNLHMDSVVVFDGSAHQQVISLPTLTTGGQLLHYRFGLEWAIENPHEAVVEINRRNRNNGGGQ